MSIKNLFRPDVLEEQADIMESLVGKALDYGKTSLQLARLKTLRKSAEVGSSLLSNSLSLFFIFSMVLFASIGMAIWLGDLLGRSCYGYFAVAAFYLVAGTLERLFLHKWFQKVTADYFIKQVLK